MSTDDTLTRAETRALARMLRNHRLLDGAGIASGRTHRGYVLRKLLARGLVKEELLAACDDDGFTIIPERWRAGYLLTPAGLALAEKLDAEADRKWRASLGVEGA